MPPTLIPYLALLPYAAVALALVITLALFLSVKVEMQRNSRRERKRIDDMLGRLQEATTPNPPETVFVPAALPPGFNINRRVHAGRLLRSGKDASHVAAVLGVPRAEVELLSRVHELTAAAGAD